MQTLRARAASRTVVGLATSVEGREGLLMGLDAALRSNGALRAQMASLLARQLHLHHTEQQAATPRR